MCYAVSIGLYIITLFRVRNAFLDSSIDQLKYIKAEVILANDFCICLLLYKVCPFNFIEKYCIKNEISFTNNVLIDYSLDI